MRTKKSPEEYIDYRRKVVRESQRRRRLLAKEQGLCSICCLNIPDAGHVTCLDCRMRISRRRHG